MIITKKVFISDDKFYDHKFFLSTIMRNKLNTKPNFIIVVGTKIVGVREVCNRYESPSLDLQWAYIERVKEKIQSREIPGKIVILIIHYKNELKWYKILDQE